MIAVFDFLLPILLFMAPVLAVVLLATLFGRRLRGSCGGADGAGSCSFCGKSADEMEKAGACSRRGKTESAPAAGVAAARR